MLTAQKKKKENIAEYILYMWQVEDLIRAYDCNMERIRTELLPQYGQSGEILQEMEQWWDNLCAMLKVEQKDRKSTRLNSSHVRSSYAVFCLKKKTQAGI